MTRRKLGRRTFLGSAGAALVAAPFVRLFESKAKADGAPAIRFLVMFTGNGFLRTPGLRTTGSGASYRFGPSLAALEPFRSKILVVEGLDQAAAYEGPGGGHPTGTGALLTGQPLQDCSVSSACFDTGSGAAGWADGPSIDQHIAGVIGATTARRSVELGVQLKRTANRARISFSGPGAPLPPTEDPFQAYTDLFDGVVASSGGTTSSADVEKRLRQRRSMLDHVRGELGELGRRLGAEESVKLEAHLTSIREVEDRLAALASGTAAAGCVPPTLGSRIDAGSAANFGQIGRLHLDLLVAAMRCDITRVGTLVWQGSVSEQTFRMPDGRMTDGHHQLSHEPDGSSKLDQLAYIDSWYAEQFAYLLNQLDSIPEGSGTMLDNMVVFWGTDVAKGSTHSRRGMQWFIAGSAGGRLRTGELVSYPGIPHNRLLVTMAHACGAPIDAWGLPMYASGGPLPGLLV